MIYHSVAEIFDAIDAVREKLVQTVSGLTSSQLIFRPEETAWTITELVEHLAKTEASLVPLVFRLLKNAEADESAPPSDGTINPPVSLVEQSEKAASMRMQAPEIIYPGGTATVAESLAKLAESRAAIQSLRPRLEAVNLSATAFPHPFFGKLNLYQWLAFIGLHESRHLAQIEKLLARMRETN